MKIIGDFLFVFSACIIGGTLGASPSQAAQMSIISFPNKLIVSANCCIRKYKE